MSGSEKKSCKRKFTSGEKSCDKKRQIRSKEGYTELVRAQSEKADMSDMDHSDTAESAGKIGAD